LFLLGKFEIWKNSENYANYELVSGWLFERDPCLFFILDSSESFGVSSTSSMDLQQPGWFCWHEHE